MPLYTFKCSNGHVDRLFAKIPDRDAVRQCPSCGANFLRMFEAPAVRPEIAPYQSPIDGRWIDSRASRREDLKRNGCMEWEPGLRQDLPRRQAEQAEKAFAPLERTIEETARQLVASGDLPPL